MLVLQLLKRSIPVKTCGLIALSFERRALRDGSCLSAVALAAHSFHLRLMT